MQAKKTISFTKTKQAWGFYLRLPIGIKLVSISTRQFVFNDEQGWMGWANAFHTLIISVPLYTAQGLAKQQLRKTAIR